jgi:sec-independent protein translocase protein TatA
MGSLSVWHWLIFLAVALLLFGGSGKISSIMGDVAKGIKSFKKGMAEDDEVASERSSAATKPEPPKVIEQAAIKPGEQQTGVHSGSKFG